MCLKCVLSIAHYVHFSVPADLVCFAWNSDFTPPLNGELILMGRLRASRAGAAADHLDRQTEAIPSSSSGYDR